MPAPTSFGEFPGLTSLIYRYTVVGSDKSSIDTGVDARDAGSGDWTNGDLLEVWMYLRDDEAVQIGDTFLTFNNDSGANQYVYERFRAVAGTLAGTEILTGANIDFWTPGSSFLANAFGVVRMTVPNYAGTVGFKAFEATVGDGTDSSGNTNAFLMGGTYRSTSAITRLAIAPPSAKKFKVGSQLLIYKRLAY